MNNNAMIIIISAPSGGGKSSIANALLKQDKNISLSISATTRAPRSGEIEGKHYFFKTKKQFQKMLNAGELLEHTEIYGNFYGTPRKYIEDQLMSGIDILFDIDIQGAKKLMNMLPERVLSIFLKPPSIAELKKRLVDRGQDSEEVIQKRMDKAEAEIKQSNLYHYEVVNDDFEKTLEQIISIIKIERRNKIS